MQAVSTRKQESLGARTCHAAAAQRSALPGRPAVCCTAATHCLQRHGSRAAASGEQQESTALRSQDSGSCRPGRQASVLGTVLGRHRWPSHVQRHTAASSTFNQQLGLAAWLCSTSHNCAAHHTIPFPARRTRSQDSQVAVAVWVPPNLQHPQARPAGKQLGI